MSRIPVLSRDEMDPEQQKVYDETLAGNDGADRQGTIGRLCVCAGPLAGSQRIECASP
jgi:hypothetical protein